MVTQTNKFTILIIKVSYKNTHTKSVILYLNVVMVGFDWKPSLCTPCPPSCSPNEIAILLPSRAEGISICA